MGIARRGNSGAVRRSGHRKHRSLEALRREPLEGHGDAVVVRDEAEELAAGNHEDPGGSPGEDVDGERPGGQEFRLAVMLAMMEEPVRRPLADDLALAALSAHQIADQRFVIDHQNAGRSGSGTTHQGDLRGLRRCGFGHVEKGRETHQRIPNGPETPAVTETWRETPASTPQGAGLVATSLFRSISGSLQPSFLSFLPPCPISPRNSFSPSMM